jgi:hypothetical protein
MWSLVGWIADPPYDLRSEIGVEKAEAFRQYRGHPYPQDNLLLKLVGKDGRGRHVAQPGGASGDAQGMA